LVFTAVIVFAAVVVLGGCSCVLLFGFWWQTPSDGCVPFCLFNAIFSSAVGGPFVAMGFRQFSVVVVCYVFLFVTEDEDGWRDRLVWFVNLEPSSGFETGSLVLSLYARKG
jgi:hypothetical protein